MSRRLRLVAVLGLFLIASMGIGCQQEGASGGGAGTKTGDRSQVSSPGNPGY